MRVLCQAVVRNEAGRYWSSWLDWYVPIFGAENIHVFDDNSDDDTAQMAVDAGVRVTARGSGPAFLEHEGQCRERAFNVMEVMLEPEPGDWVFSIDADEFLVGRKDERAELYRSCEWANEQRRGAFLVRIPEVFRVETVGDNKLVDPQVRIDGFWGNIIGTRLFAWKPDGVFSGRVMGSGSEPTYVVDLPRSNLQDMWLLHYGYARLDDRHAKYERYTARPGNHNNVHIQSIVMAPTLAPWDGPVIDIYVGPRPPAGPGQPVDVPLTPIAES